VSYDPNQPPGSYPPPPGYGYQPPEGTHPGTYPRPTPGEGYPGGYVPPPGGAPPYGGQPQYYAGYQGPMAPSTSSWAIASLALSIASFFVLPIIGAVLGIIFGHMALNEIKQSQGRVEGRGMALGGLIVGYVHLGLAICLAAGFIVLFIVAANSQMH
jgi:hypothetical protein